MSEDEPEVPGGIDTPVDARIPYVREIAVHESAEDVKVMRLVGDPGAGTGEQRIVEVGITDEVAEQFYLDALDILLRIRRDMAEMEAIVRQADDEAAARERLGMAPAERAAEDRDE